MKKDFNNIRATVYIGNHPFKEYTIYYDYNKDKMKNSWKSNEPEYVGPYDYDKIGDDAAKQWLKMHKNEILDEIINDICTGKLKLSINVSDYDMWEIDDEKEEVIHL